MDADETTPEGVETTPPAGETGPGQDDAAGSGADPVGQADGPASAAPVATAFVVGLPTAAAARLAEAGITTTDDVATADLVVVSTRDPLAELPTGGPDLVVALVHPGGEDRAVQLLAGGARTVVAEGREVDVLALVADAPTTPAGLGARPAGGSVADAAAPDAAIVVLRLGHLAAPQAGGQVTSLVRHRVATRWRAILGQVGADLHDTEEPERFVATWPAPRIADIRALTSLLAAGSEGFLPTGVSPLGFAAGIAFPDDASGAAARLQLADRAARAAMSSRRASLTVAEMLLEDAGTTTRGALEAAVRTVETTADLGGHGSAVARLVEAAAAVLALPPGLREPLQATARFHHVGLLGAGAEGRCDASSAARSSALLTPHLGRHAGALLGDGEGTDHESRTARDLLALCDRVDLRARADGSEHAEALARILAEGDDVPERTVDALRTVLGVARAQAASA